MSRSDAEWADWARQNRVAYEVAPIVESRGGDKVQVGFTFSLYAAIPTDKPLGRERQRAGEQLMEEMRALVQHAAPAETNPAGVSLEPPHLAVLRPENELRPEVGLTWRAVHPDEYLKTVTAEERGRMGQFEKRLSALGLRHGHW